MKRRYSRSGQGFVLVGALGFMFLYVIPLIWGTIYCFEKQGKLSISRGSHIFAEVMSSSSFGLAFRNTVLFILVCVPILLLLAIVTTFCIEYSMEKGKKIRGWLELGVISYIIPSAVISQVISYIFREKMYLLKSTGAVVLLCIIYIWKNLGYITLIVMSGCTTIGIEQKEASSVEGATKEEVFRYIVLPQLKMFIRFAMVIGIAGVFKIYRESVLLFGNNPCDEVYMLQNFLNNNFESWNYERAIMASVILFIVMTVLWVCVFKRRSQDEAD